MDGMKQDGAKNGYYFVDVGDKSLDSSSPYYEIFLLQNKKINADVWGWNPVLMLSENGPRQLDISLFKWVNMVNDAVEEGVAAGVEDTESTPKSEKLYYDSEQNKLVVMYFEGDEYVTFHQDSYGNRWVEGHKPYENIFLGDYGTGPKDRGGVARTRLRIDNEVARNESVVYAIKAGKGLTVEQHYYYPLTKQSLPLSRGPRPQTTDAGDLLQDVAPIIGISQQSQ